MAEVKWIKITTDMFEDEKIDFIESLPEADTLIVIWIKLLTMAGKCNSGGYIFLTDTIPYDDEMLAHRMRRPINVVKLALGTFQKLGMVHVDGNGLVITNWAKHQNVQGLDLIREQNKLRQKRFREQQKLLDSNVTVTLSNTIEEDKERDKDIYKVPYLEIQELFNKICISFPQIRSVTEKRKPHIKARWIQHKNDINIFRQAFEKVEQSNFCKGENDRNWWCSFDWLIANDTNMVKVLEGKYDNKTHKYRATPKNRFHNFDQPALKLTNEELTAILEKKKAEHDQKISEGG
jgi:predicted phage replisome organizer